MREDSSLDPRLEAQLYKVLEAVSRAYERGVIRSDNLATGRCPDQKAARALIREELIKNPHLKVSVLASSLGVADQTVFHIRKKMGITPPPRPRPLADAINEYRAKHPDAGANEIAKAVGTSRNYVLEIIRKSK